jgi:hypothetical protein
MKKLAAAIERTMKEECDAAGRKGSGCFLSVVTRRDLLLRLLTGSERTLQGIAWVERNMLVAPEPSHHLRQHGAAHVVAVHADPPRIVDVGTLLGFTAARKDLDNAISLNQKYAPRTTGVASC